MTDTHEHENVVSEIPIEYEFYVVSKRKFWLLYIITAGMYGIYWNYKNWERYQKTSNEDILPSMRTIFNIFFIHSLLKHINNKLSKVDSQINFKHKKIATIIVGIYIAQILLSLLITESNILYPYINIVFGNIFIFIIAYLKSLVQTYINIACSDPIGNTNNEITTANKIWFAIGIYIWIDTLVSLVTGTYG